MFFTAAAPSRGPSIDRRRVSLGQPKGRLARGEGQERLPTFELIRCWARGAAILLVWSLLDGSNARADTAWWNNGVGNWFDISNWSDYVPDTYNGALISNGGTARIADPGAVARFVNLGHSPASSGTLEVLGNNAQFSDILIVGGQGAGTLSIASGGKVANPTGLIGYYPATTGTVTVDGAGSEWRNSIDLVAGVYGTGSLGITGGGAVFSGDSIVGQSVGSKGTVLIDGPGSRWNVSAGKLTVGPVSGGTGTLEIRNGGVLSAASGMTLGFNGTLRGDGTIVASLINDGGFIAPGAVTDTTHGALHITGNFAQQRPQSSRLQIQVASATSSDKLAVTGNMALSGQLDITLTGGYVPHGTKSFDILDWGGSLSGQFDFIILRPFGAMLTLDTSQLYTTGVVTIVGPGASYTADFDEDGDVDGDDLVQWRGDFGRTP